MPADATVTLTIEELQAIREQAAVPTEAGFSVEEMAEIRGQYEARLREAEARERGEIERREEMEFRARLALSQLRDLDARPRMPAAEIERVRESLKALLADVDEPARVKGPTAPVPPRRPPPPPLPRRTLPHDYKKRALA